MIRFYSSLIVCFAFILVISVSYAQNQEFEFDQDRVKTEALTVLRDFTQRNSQIDKLESYNLEKPQYFAVVSKTGSKLAIIIFPHKTKENFWANAAFSVQNNGDYNFTGCGFMKSHSVDDVVDHIKRMDENKEYL